MIFQGFSDCRDIFHLYNMREKTYIANQFLRMCLSNGCLDRSFTALNKSSAAMQQSNKVFDLRLRKVTNVVPGISVVANPKAEGPSITVFQKIISRN